MKVSVCIPTFNQEQYIEKAVRSAFEQTLQPIEIIVSDDCSTDSTRSILQKLAQEIPVVKVVNQPQNLGIARNTDACLRMATGDFIIRLDSDDYLHPEYVEKLSQALTAHPEAAYAHAAVQEIDQHSNFTKPRKLFRRSGFQPAAEALQAAVKGYRVAANIIMFRKSALQAANYNTGRPDYVEDFHLSADLAARGHGNVYLDEQLSYYRVWVDAGKVRQRRKLMEIIGLRRVFEDILEPSFRARNWSMAPLAKQRAAFAAEHADCLGWDVYTDAEREELATALQALSSSPRARLFISMYRSGNGSVLSYYAKLSSSFKQLAKHMVLRLK
jgi:glycosyltransferase involved in cell wall biosynthesis